VKNKITSQELLLMLYYCCSCCCCCFSGNGQITETHTSLSIGFPLEYYWNSNETTSTIK